MSRSTAVLSRYGHSRFFYTALVVAVAGSVLVPRLSRAQLAGPRPDDRNITVAITRLMSKEHLTRHALDNEIAGRWVTNYLKMLDPRKVFFSKSDIDGFMKYRDQLDDMALKGDTSFAYLVFNRFLERLDDRVKLVDELLPIKQDFTIDEDLITDPDLISYAKDDAEMRERWRQRIKYELLELASEKAKPEPGPNPVNKEPEGETKFKLDSQASHDKISKRYHQLVKRMKQTEPDELLEIYLTALTTSYDPHTSYMSPTSLENFEIQMRLNLEGIGAALEAPEGETIVKKVIPGGAAAKDGRLKPDDKIVGVGQGQEGPIVDVNEMKLNNVVKLIRGHQGTTVRLAVVPKGEADTRIYNIVRQQIELTDSEARSEILEAGSRPDGTPYKVGVINLPSFYMDMSGAKAGREDFKSTTRDVAKLLKDFNAHKVDAVVIDLRLNGGGSLTESINLTGLFIDVGPVVQVKDFDGQKTQYDDTERGVAWAGPLVVLTSKYSASASEIFAGAIQDYKRGLVVGDASTHGKGTVQSLLDLGQRLFRGINKAPELGALKITMQQFYRPDGDSTQNRGVLADVELPSLRSQYDVGESSLPYAMKFDHVDPVSYRKYNFVDNRIIDQLKNLSADRRKDSKDFQKVLRDIEHYNEQNKRKRISLNEAKFMAERAELNSEKQEEGEFDELNDPNRPVFKRDYYGNEVLAIATDYVRLLGAPQAAAVGQRSR
ncbi:MAG: carboxy terminal-processing peptidase [Planctomycetia bacterium]|nr:carboxy terminal-processing peptidase [Planctomycetia bacterium]